jgi:hypothetical protein
MYFRDALFGKVCCVDVTLGYVGWQASFLLVLHYKIMMLRFEFFNLSPNEGDILANK